MACLNSSCVKHRQMSMLQLSREKKIGIPETYQIVNESAIQHFDRYRVQAFDQLMIRINAFDGDTEKFLNRQFADEGGAGGNMDYSPAAVYFNSYTINEKGTLELPLVGEIKVEGLTTEEIRRKLDKAFKPYFKYPAASVKLANLRATILGEVERPGVVYLYDERMTIIDLISSAGDFTAFANIEKVKLVRQTQQGIQTVYINFTNPKFLESEYYFVEPHDFLYVEPLKQKSLDSSANTVGVIASAVSIATLVVSLFLRN
ncbi:MAG: polysaccharide biosynthesis/export family protein [Bacteroidota bacterium]